jgi:predicted RNA-binding protein YlqC (UPF0109 family)
VQQGDQVLALIWQLVGSVVDTPSEVAVEATNENGLTRYSVRVKEGEVGQVIGRGGRTASALRTLLAAVAMKEKRRLELHIATSSTPLPASANRSVHR